MENFQKLGTPISSVNQFPWFRSWNMLFWGVSIDHHLTAAQKVLFRPSSWTLKTRHDEKLENPKLWGIKMYFCACIVSSMHCTPLSVKCSKMEQKSRVPEFSWLSSCIPYVLINFNKKEPYYSIPCQEYVQFMCHTGMVCSNIFNIKLETKYSYNCCKYKYFLWFQGFFSHSQTGLLLDIRVVHIYHVL